MLLLPAKYSIVSYKSIREGFKSKSLLTTVRLSCKYSVNSEIVLWPTI